MADRATVQTLLLLALAIRGDTVSAADQPQRRQVGQKNSSIKKKFVPHYSKVHYAHSVLKGTQRYTTLLKSVDNLDNLDAMPSTTHSSLPQRVHPHLLLAGTRGSWRPLCTHACLVLMPALDLRGPPWRGRGSSLPHLWDLGGATRCEGARGTYRLEVGRRTREFSVGGSGAGLELASPLGFRGCDTLVVGSHPPSPLFQKHTRTSWARTSLRGRVPKICHLPCLPCLHTAGADVLPPVPVFPILRKSYWGHR